YAPTGFYVGGWIDTGPSTRIFDGNGKATVLPIKGHPRPPGPWLAISMTASPRAHRLPIENVAADWDEQRLASAIQLSTSHRVISVPSPGLIAGDSIWWSPDRSHLAFVADLSEPCTPRNAITDKTTPHPSTELAAAFVADASTGTLQELERGANGIAI